MGTSQHLFQITKLDNWGAVLEGDANGDGSNGEILEIKGGTELQVVPDSTREAMLAAVASFGGVLVGTYENYPEQLDKQLLAEPAPPERTRRRASSRRPAS